MGIVRFQEAAWIATASCRCEEVQWQSPDATALLRIRLSPSGSGFLGWDIGGTRAARATRMPSANATMGCQTAMVLDMLASLVQTQFSCIRRMPTLMYGPSSICGMPWRILCTTFRASGRPFFMRQSMAS